VGPRARERLRLRRHAGAGQGGVRRGGRARRRPHRPLRRSPPSRSWSSRGCSASPLPRDRASGCSSLLGGVGYVGQALLYFTALERISAGLTALLLYVIPALVVVLSAVLLRERPRPLAGRLRALALAGTALTIGPVQGGQSSGVALGLGSALVYAVYILTSSRVTGVGPLAMAAVVLGAARGDVRRARRRHPADAAVVGERLARARRRRAGGDRRRVTAFFGAMALLGPSDVSVLSTFEPVVSVAVAGLVLGERLTWTQVAGGAVVLVAVAVLARAGTSAAEPEAVPA
jgi:drug/metabolite transporter (DMT)-like permease